jgi:O-antigen ligase
MSVVNAPPRHQASPFRPHAVVGPTDAYRMSRAFLFLMTLMTVDVFNVLDRPEVSGLPVPNQSRYLVLLIPIIVVAAVRMREPSLLVRAPGGSDMVLGVMFVLGLGGSLVGVAFLGTQDTSRPVFLPMSLGLLYLLTLREPSDGEVRRITDWLGLIGLLYVLMNAAVNLGILPGLLQYKQYRNASFAFVALAIGAAYVTGRKRRLVLILVLTGAIFVTYPSATSLVVIVAMGLTMFLTGRRATGLRSIVVTGLVLITVTFALANFQQGVRLASRYFEAVGKVDANAGRLDLWASGVDRWRESPIYGSVFSGEAVAQRVRDEKALPFHNDFVLFLAEGGLIGFGLLVAWIVLTEVTLVRRYRRFIAAGQQERADLMRIILVFLNAFFAAMLFNPVLPGASRSATIFGLYAIVMSLGDPAVAARLVSKVPLHRRALSAPAAPSS